MTMRRLELVAHSLRAYRGSTLLLVGAATTGFATVLSILGLARGYHLPLIPATDLGLRLSGLATSPGALQRRGLELIGGVNVVIAIGVLAVAVVTLLALSFARADSRHSEMRLRRAVGASRKLLLSTGIIEGGMTAIAAAVAGAAIAVVALREIRSSWPGSLDAPALFVPIVVALGLAAVIVLGALFPVIAARRIHPPIAPGKIPPGLVIAALQLGISFAVLLGGQQLATKAHQLGGVTSHQSDGRVFDLTIAGTPAERSKQLEHLMRHSRVAGLFDLTSIASPGALAGLGTVDLAITECGRCSQGGIATPLRAVPVAISSVSPDSFRAMNVQLAQGRLFRETDDWSSPRAVVINRSLARDHFEAGNAVGRRLQLGEGPENSFVVVGMVEDTQPIALGGALQPPYAVYTSVLQLPPSTVEVLVRGRSVGVSAAGSSGSEAAYWAAYTAPLEWFARALSFGGGLILIIAALGTGICIYQWVAATMPELAIRRAVGARRRAIGVYVFSRVVAVAVAGVAFGLVLNDFSSLPLAAVTSGLPTPQRGVVLQMGLVILGAALAGAWIPAWRVSRLDPAGLMAQLEA